MNALEILEQAVNLLRGAPARAILSYLTGAVPFAVALLFFLNDMNRSPYAFDHLALGSAGVAALYIWKNAWQAVFARRLYETLSPDQPRLPLLKTICVQAALQPVGLAIALPFPWLVAFFRNVALITALGWPSPIRTARRQAVLWTSQNWGILALMSVAGLLLFGNILIVIMILPQMARSFLGIEGEFARLGVRILNLTTVAVAVALAWLILDPLFDAVYVLRCFYGQSIVTGEDLRSALRQTAAAVLVVIALLFVVPSRASAQVDPSKLDQSIGQVIHSREFTWRSPRPPDQEPQGRWVGWIRSAEDLVNRGWEALWRILRSIFDRKPEPEKRGNDSPVTRRELEGIVAIALALAGGAAFVFFSRKRQSVVAAAAVTASPAVDLADESVIADQLPESSWLKLADEWLAKGDHRMALRALYLAGLNYLSEHNLVSIRRWKSGLDYRQEIGRRNRDKPEITSAFSINVDLFERGWYGMRGADRGMVEQFASGLSEIRRNVERS